MAKIPATKFQIKQKSKRLRKPSRNCYPQDEVSAGGFIRRWTSLATLYPEARGRSGVLKTSRELEEMKEESFRPKGERVSSVEIFRKSTQFAFKKKQELASA